MQAGTDTPETLLINKPSGITSFDVIRRLRKTLGIRKLGHAGTLDPLADGLIIIGVGAGTKKLSEYIKLDKTYEAEILLGTRTDTGDIQGNVLEETEVEDFSEEEMKLVLASCVGDLELPVPAYSAIKQGGVPLYRKARRGEDFSVPIRTMRIYSIELLGMRRDAGRTFASVRMDVASGVYVRSVAVEIGRRLGVPATVSRLKRTRIGGFSLADARDLP